MTEAHPHHAEAGAAIDLTVALSLAERLRAEAAIALGRGVGALGMLAPAALGILMLTSPLDPAPAWVQTFVGVLLMALVPGKILLMSHRGLRRSAREGPYFCRMSPDGFELKSRTAELKLAWRGIPRVTIRLGFMLIYANERSACPLPLRLLSDEQVRAVIGMARDGGTGKVAV